MKLSNQTFYRGLKDLKDSTINQSSFFETLMPAWKFNSRKISQQLTYSASWDNRHNKWRFRCYPRPGCLNFLLSVAPAKSPRGNGCICAPWNVWPLSQRKNHDLINSIYYFWSINLVAFNQLTVFVTRGRHKTARLSSVLLRKHRLSLNGWELKRLRADPHIVRPWLSYVVLRQVLNSFISVETENVVK